MENLPATCAVRNSDLLKKKDYISGFHRKKPFPASILRSVLFSH